jgi:hypothetical protein
MTWEGHTALLLIKDTIPRSEILNQVQDDERGTFHMGRAYCFGINGEGHCAIQSRTLLPGTYQVRITTQFSGSKTPLKSPRTFTYEPVLTVV